MVGASKLPLKETFSGHTLALPSNVAAPPPPTCTTLQKEPRLLGTSHDNAYVTEDVWFTKSNYGNLNSAATLAVQVGSRR